MNITNTSYINIMDRYKNLVDPGQQSLANQPKPSEDNNIGVADFEELIGDKIDKLNQVQVQSDNLIQDFAAGNTQDLHQVMIAAEEARLSMELAVQIRNKAVEAYKELNNMQL